MSRPSHVVAIIDTNVILDIFSMTDLMTAAMAASPPDTDSSDAYFRRIRSRESLLLAWFLHTRAATTISLHHEVIRALTRAVDPTAVRTREWQHVQLSIYLLKDRVLDRWDGRAPADSDRGLTNHQGDDLLLHLARKYGAPLITNEGYSLQGVSDLKKDKLRFRAKEQGIEVHTPREFWGGRMGERACRKFLARYDRVVPRFLRRQNNAAGALEAVRFRRGFLDHVFYGHTDGLGTFPVLPPWLIRAK